MCVSELDGLHLAPERHAKLAEEIARVLREKAGLRSGFRAMRRSRQQLSQEEAAAILEEGLTGILGVNGDMGYPYTVPVNYLYREGKIICHGARSGHKFDAMLRSDKVSFCVIARDEIVPEEVTDYFRSAIAFGRVRLIEEPEAKREAALALGRKYSPEEAVQEDMRRSYERVAMFEIEIEHLSGKEAIELVKMRQENGPRRD